MTSETELEQRFEVHGYSRRLLYPLWYRTNQKLGIRHKPPVLLNILEHYLYMFPGLAIIVASGFLAHRWLTGEHLSSPGTPILVWILAPLVGWLRYWFIRRRIGLAGKAEPGN